MHSIIDILRYSLQVIKLTHSLWAPDCLLLAPWIIPSWRIPNQCCLRLLACSFKLQTWLVLRNWLLHFLTWNVWGENRWRRLWVHVRREWLVVMLMVGLLESFLMKQISGRFTEIPWGNWCSCRNSSCVFFFLSPTNWAPHCLLA